jgi:hypothetical protein
MLRAGRWADLSIFPLVSLLVASGTRVVGRMTPPFVL